jgi:hypothetical protein
MSTTFGFPTPFSPKDRQEEKHPRINRKINFFIRQKLYLEAKIKECTFV